MTLGVGCCDEHHRPTRDERTIFCSECGTYRHFIQTAGKWPRLADVLKLPHTFVIRGVLNHGVPRVYALLRSNAPDLAPKNFGVAFAAAKDMTKFFGRS